MLSYFIILYVIIKITLNNVLRFFSSLSNQSDTIIFLINIHQLTLTIYIFNRYLSLQISLTM